MRWWAWWGSRAGVLGAAGFELAGEEVRGFDEEGAVVCEGERFVWVDGDDQVDAGGEPALLEAEGFAEEALEVVAGDGVAEAAADGEAQARVGEGAPAGVDAEGAAVGGAARGEDGLELAVVREALAAAEEEFLGGGGGHGGGYGRCGSLPKELHSASQASKRQLEFLDHFSRQTCTIYTTRSSAVTESAWSPDLGQQRGVAACVCVPLCV